MGLNEEIFLMINKPGNPLLDLTMIFVAKYLIYFVGGYVFYLLLKKDKKALIVIVSGLIGILINQGISLAYYYPRPFAQGLGSQIISHSADSSFPSDHATAGLSLAFPFLFYKKSRTKGIILTLLAFLIGFARIYCGVHYPFDIIGSAIVSLIATLIAYASREKIISFEKLVTRKIMKH